MCEAIVVGTDITSACEALLSIAQHCSALLSIAKHCDKIIPFLDQYPIIGIKNLDYLARVKIAKARFKLEGKDLINRKRYEQVTR